MMGCMIDEVGIQGRGRREEGREEGREKERARKGQEK